MKPLPPYAQLLQLRTEERDGSLRFVMPFHDDVVGRPGYLHGGAIAGLLEFAAFTALSRAVGDEVVKKPITVTVDYMRGGTSQDTYAEALIERLGKRMAARGSARTPSWPAAGRGSARCDWQMGLTKFTTARSP